MQFIFQESFLLGLYKPNDSGDLLKIKLEMS